MGCLACYNGMLIGQEVQGVLWWRTYDRTMWTSSTSSRHRLGDRQDLSQCSWIGEVWLQERTATAPPVQETLACVRGQAMRMVMGKTV
jgi:hypothetical protein